MPALLIASAEPLAGKTAVAVGLAQRLRDEGRRVALFRLGGDDHAAADAALFASLPFNSHPSQEPLAPSAVSSAAAQADVTIVEAPAGHPAEALAALGGKALAVHRYRAQGLDPLSDLCRALGGSLAGVVATCVPERRKERVAQELAAAGLSALALVPEDRTLAAPTLAQLSAALEAEAAYLEEDGQRLIERPLISSISADPGQAYFTYHRPSAVIVRSDKPDQQLAALNAGVPCLIITGGRSPLSYVLDRAQGEEVPILQTGLDTVSTVRRIEEMYAAVPFAGQAKIERVASLLAGVDLSRLGIAK